MTDAVFPHSPCALLDPRPAVLSSGCTFSEINHAAMATEEITRLPDTIISIDRKHHHMLYKAIPLHYLAIAVQTKVV